MKIDLLAFLRCIPVISGLLFLLPACNPAPEFLHGSGNPANQKNHKNSNANMVFRSIDNGQTWQDISKGLPENLPEDGIPWDSLSADDKGLFLKVANETYRSSANAEVPFWAKTILPGEPGSITSGKNGMLVSNYWAVDLKKANGTDVWSPMFDSTSEPRIRSVFETAGGAIFLGTDRGFFKTADAGQAWKHVYDGGWAGNMAESNGVLVTTSKRKIIRSADDGEHWEPVTGDGAVTWDVKPFKAGFVAIVSGSASTKRDLWISSDGGKTWQPADAVLREKAVIDSIWRSWDDRPRVQAFQSGIIRVGENLFAINARGIFRSSDKGKTWKCSLTSVKDKSLSLFSSGKVMYAVAVKGGC